MTLTRYTGMRILQAVPVLVGVATITFFLVHAIPGNPIQTMAGASPSAAQIAAIKHKYGLDQPVYVQYGRYLWNLAHLDMGESLYYKTPVTAKIAQRLPITLVLLVSSFVFALVTAIPLGMISAQRRNKPTDHVSRVVALIGVSTPDFWIGLVLITIFAFDLGWLPATGLVMPWAAPAAVDGAATRVDVLVEFLKHIVMPAITLGTLQMAAVTRIERSSMLEVLSQDYVKLARAYGVREGTILRKHAFKNAQLPVITIIGLQLTAALGGAVLTETVFNINGMGRLIIQAVNNQDYPLIMGTTLYFALLFVIGVIITDVSYALIDPRVSYGEESP